MLSIPMLLLVGCQKTEDTGTAPTADTAEDDTPCLEPEAWMGAGEAMELLPMGSEADPAAITLTEDTTLHLCGGTLYATIDTAGFDLTLTGAEATLSAAGSGRIQRDVIIIPVRGSVEIFTENCDLTL